ncbi:homoserine kinase [Helicobacter mustelae]|uniref:homoserine kinase n=1 Tax=Helicobacter mustelae TaxID=217 RepID=UPI000DFC66A9|nr:homoserine kinase [Helicobacter mustelae]STP12075.1 homoserine kinase [Helicobacter mustelae]
MIISVPATSANLGPGFDTLGLSLDFRNYFKITPASIQSIEIIGEGESHPKIKMDNVFVKLFLKELKKQGYPKANYAFEFKNNIPISRGMGSSSAIITGAVGAAQYLQNAKFDKQKILDTALIYENHPDNITPAVFGGFNAAVVENGAVHYLREEIPSQIRAVIVIPNRPISTKYSRQALPKHYSCPDCVYNLSRSSLMCLAFAQKRWDLLRLASQDRFHQYYRMKQYPVLFAIQKVALEQGAFMSTLSGSGSSFFNLCAEDDSPKLARILQERFPHFRVLDLGFDNEGIRIEES